MPNQQFLTFLNPRDVFLEYVFHLSYKKEETKLMNRLGFFSKITALLIILILVFACQKNDLLSPEEQQSLLKVNLNGLQTPAPNARYVMWAVYDSAKIELYTQIDSFTVDGNGQLVDMEYDLNMGVLQKCIHY